MTKAEIVAVRLRERVETVEPGGRLPSFRRLMAELGVSQSTVAAAVGRLVAEGRIERRGGSGLYATAEAHRRPVLLVCETASFMGDSPFWEMMMEGLLAPYEKLPGGLVVEFTTPSLVPRGEMPPERQLTEATWTRLRSRAFSGVMLACVDESLAWRVERTGVPVVAFGCPGHHMIRLAAATTCTLGVEELVRLGCARIALYNAPHFGAREMFSAALRAHGASEHVVPPTVVFRSSLPQLGRRFRMVDVGLREATRLFGPDSNPSDRPDGILSADDTFTQGFLMGLHRHGVELGKVVRIASHFNRGSPTLEAWKDEIVRLEFSVREIVTAMNSGVAQLVRGEVPNRDGWERSTIENGKQGPLRVLDLAATVRRPRDLV